MGRKRHAFAGGRKTPATPPVHPWGRGVLGGLWIGGMSGLVGMGFNVSEFGFETWKVRGLGFEWVDELVVA